MVMRIWDAFMFQGEGVMVAMSLVLLRIHRSEFTISLLSLSLLLLLFTSHRTTPQDARGGHQTLPTAAVKGTIWWGCSHHWTGEHIIRATQGSSSYTAGYSAPPAENWGAEQTSTAGFGRGWEERIKIGSSGVDRTCKATVSKWTCEWTSTSQTCWKITSLGHMTSLFQPCLCVCQHFNVACFVSYKAYVDFKSIHSYFWSWSSIFNTLSDSKDSI